MMSATLPAGVHIGPSAYSAGAPPWPAPRVLLEGRTLCVGTPLPGCKLMRGKSRATEFAVD